MVCVKCGKEIPDEGRFCPFCGAPAQPEEAAPAVEAASLEPEEVRAGTEAAPGEKTGPIPQPAAYSQQPSEAPAQPVRQPRGPLLAPKPTAVISYITWIGWLFAFFAGSRRDPFARFHLNQSLVIHIAGVILWLMKLGVTTMWGQNMLSSGVESYGNFVFVLYGGIIAILEVCLLLVWIVAFISVAQGKKAAIPLLGEIQILK